MTRSTDLDQLLSTWLEEDGATVLRRDVLVVAMAEARRKNQARRIGLRALAGPPRPLVWIVLLGVLIALLLVAGLLAGSAPTVHPQPSLTAFTVTDSMTVPRSGQAATLLKDGRVLISGGSYLEASGYAKVLDSAEIYDPATGSFTPTASMISPRTAATTTLLDDGRVLVAGGRYNDLDVLDTAELYDPASGTWTSAGVMTIPRAAHAAILLQDGRVLIAGGSTENLPLAVAELYDPRTGTFTRTTQAMTVARDWPVATRLADGRVFIGGGSEIGPRPGAAVHSAELFDPATETFAQVARPNLDCCSGQAVLLNDGSVLTGGGFRSPLLLRFDPTSQSFTYTRPTLAPRTGDWTLLGDGRALLFGGGQAGDPCKSQVATTEFYDPSAGEFSQGPVMTRARLGQTATVLDDGTVLVAGGGCDESDVTDTAEVLR